MALDALAPVADDVAFAIVGSVATGFCRTDSDIDIAVIVSERVRRLLRSRVPHLVERWGGGRPTEEVVAGRQLHWYAVSTTEVRRALLCHNDGAMYAYGTAQVLRDPNGRLGRIVARHGPQVAKVRASRIEGKLDMLQRRAGVLPRAYRDGRVMVARMALEVIVLGLKTIALLDGAVGFRKDLEACAFAGGLGGALRAKLLQALAGIGELGRADRLTKQLVVGSIVRPLGEVVDACRCAARSQGMRDGLPRPDPRHVEPQPPPALLWKRRSEWLRL